jgi:hypothetical protein
MEKPFMKKHKNNFCTSRLARKIISFCIALTMIFTLLPTSAFPTEVGASESKTIKIHYNNSQSNWSNVYGYTWNTTGGNTLYSGSWPGKQVSPNNDNTNWYTMEVSGVTASNIGVIFNNGSGSQTNDIFINGITDGGEYWVWFDSYDAPSYSAPSGWISISEPRDITIHYKNSNNWGSLYGYAWTANNTILNGSWPGRALAEDSKHSGWYTMTLYDVTASQIGVIFSNKGLSQTSDITISNIPTEDAEYWYDGSLSSSAPLGWNDEYPNSDCCWGIHLKY